MASSGRVHRFPPFLLVLPPKCFPSSSSSPAPHGPLKGVGGEGPGQTRGHGRTRRCGDRPKGTIDYVAREPGVGKPLAVPSYCCLRLKMEAKEWPGHPHWDTVQSDDLLVSSRDPSLSAHTRSWVFAAQGIVSSPLSPPPIPVCFPSLEHERPKSRVPTRSPQSP